MMCLPIGSTLANLACSGDPFGGFPLGKYVFFVGDSNSGKTFVGLTCLAEAANDKRFDGYRLIHDDVEGGALMDMERFFGTRMADRLESPAVDSKGDPVYSSTVEDFYYHLDDALSGDRPCVYVLDSQDGLSSRAEMEKFAETKKLHRKGKSASGSYGDAKAKVHSANIRKFIRPLEETGSLLIVLNQTRDSFDMFERSTYSGGRALKFYSALQLWTSVEGQVTRQVRGKTRQLGIRCKIRVKKNRLTGKDRTVSITIHHSHGIDDVGSCVDYLVREGVWKKSKTGKVTVTGLGPSWEGGQEAVVGRIEERGMERDVRLLVGETWNEIERACEVPRKKRYE